jgi:pyocin large subunit-like protein
LAGCEGKPSAVAGKDGGSSSQASLGQGSGGQGYGRSPDPRDLPVPKIAGKPMWAANRRHTAEENAQYQFSRNGSDFDAKSETDYVTKAHAFVDKPPRDIETLLRPNGDKLLYDPKANVFAVVTRDGAPRTMFKPRDGASYWQEQKDRESKRSKGGGQDGGSEQS